CKLITFRCVTASRNALSIRLDPALRKASTPLHRAIISSGVRSLFVVHSEMLTPLSRKYFNPDSDIFLLIKTFIPIFPKNEIAKFLPYLLPFQFNNKSASRSHWNFQSS